jgi:hypothetical protein
MVSNFVKGHTVSKQTSQSTSARHFITSQNSSKTCQIEFETQISSLPAKANAKQR